MHPFLVLRGGRSNKSLPDQSFRSDYTERGRGERGGGGVQNGPSRQFHGTMLRRAKALIKMQSRVIMSVFRSAASGLPPHLFLSTQLKRKRPGFGPAVSRIICSAA
jgi:hypothetical protein